MTGNTLAKGVKIKRWWRYHGLGLSGAMFSGFSISFPTLPLIFRVIYLFFGAMLMFGGFLMKLSEWNSMDRGIDPRLDMPDSKAVALSNLTRDQARELLRCFAEIRRNQWLKKEGG